MCPRARHLIPTLLLSVQLYRTVALMPKNLYVKVCFLCNCVSVFILFSGLIQLVVARCNGGLHLSFFKGVFSGGMLLCSSLVVVLVYLLHY